MSIEKERYLNIIYKSPVIFRIKEVALPAFRFFEIEATKKHPRIQIEVDDKTIIKDMIDCCGEALYSLFQDEKKEKHNIRGWSTGYILGFLSSSLWTHWNAEYLYPETEEYKTLMFLRSIYLYSKMDYQYNYQLTFKIQKIYDYFMSHKSDFNSIANTGDNLISLENFKKKKGIPDNQKFANSFINYLESLLLQEHDKIFKKISVGKDNNLQNIRNLFNSDEINELIKFAEQQSQ